MSLVLDTSAVEEVARAQFVHEALAMTMVPVELHWPRPPRGVAAHGVITELGDLTVCSIQTCAFKVERTPALARDARVPSIFVNVQLTGSSMVIQGDREAVLHPGELVIYDSTAPYTQLNDTGMSGVFFRISHAALALTAESGAYSRTRDLSPQPRLRHDTYLGGSQPSACGQQPVVEVGGTTHAPTPKTRRSHRRTTHHPSRPF
jgi:AraC-binding-like domain